MKSRKRHITNGIELPDQDQIRTHREKETYKYLGNLKADTIKQVEMKRKILKRKTRNLLETKLYCSNLIKEINIWTLPLVRYSGTFLNWNREEPNQMDQRTRKLMNMHMV